jgi:hypothetical protein
MFGVSARLHDVLGMHRHEMIQEALARLQQKSRHQRTVHAIAARWQSLYGPGLREPGMAADQAGGPGNAQCRVTDSSSEKFCGKEIGW